MEKIFICILLYLSINLFAQDCSVDSFITNNYNYDAELLAVREIQSDNNHIYWDSVHVPSLLKNKYLKILSSIYNYESTELIDTLFDLYKLHVFAEYSVISIEVKPNTDWVDTLKIDSTYSGNPTVDSIINDYSFRLESTWNFGNYSYIFIKSPYTLNLLPVIDKLNRTDGVIFAEFFGFQLVIEPIDCEDNGANDIMYSKIDETEYLTFKKSMGACPDNCFKSKYWKYQILNDCDINYIDSYCQTYDNIRDSEIISKQIVFPNPFCNYIQIPEELNYSRIVIYNLSGEMVYENFKWTNQIDLSRLEKGIYFVLIIKDNNIYNQKIEKL